MTQININLTNTEHDMFCSCDSCIKAKGGVDEIHKGQPTPEDSTAELREKLNKKLYKMLCICGPDAPGHIEECPSYLVDDVMAAIQEHVAAVIGEDDQSHVMTTWMIVANQLRAEQRRRAGLPEHGGER